MCNAYNHPPGCNCGFGGGRGSKGGSKGGRPSSNVDLYAQPKTQPIKCWWCSSSVYYHTNGYGDSVLFNSLGYPWQIHECWQEHKDEIHHQKIETNVLQPYISDFVKTPTSQKSLTEKIIGYIIDNHIFHTNRETFTLSINGSISKYKWIYIDVSDEKERYFRFLIPSHLAYDYKNSSIVEILGQWIKKENRYILVVAEISKINYPSGNKVKKIVIPAPTKPKPRPIQRKNKSFKEDELPVAKKKRREKPQSHILRDKPSQKKMKVVNPQQPLRVKGLNRNSKRNLVLSMYQEGKSFQEIAEYLDIKNQTHIVQMLLKAAILIAKKKQKISTEEAVAKIINMSVEQLEQKFGYLYEVGPLGMKLKGKI